MQMGTLKGWHVVVLMFAALLLAVPISHLVHGALPEAAISEGALGRMVPFVLAALLITLVPPIRRQIRAQLSIPIPPDRRREVLLAAGLDVGLGFAWMGAIVVWWSLAEGPLGLMQRVGGGSHEAAMARALSVEGVVIYLILAGTIAPIVEEIVYRGLLFPLWERDHGWLPATLMTSALFALYHPHFVPAFLASVIFTCVYSRTRSLRASILVHACGNLFLYYPLFGRYVVPQGLSAPGDPQAWLLHIAILTIFVVAFPFYVFLSYATARDGRNESHVPVPG